MGPRWVHDPPVARGPGSEIRYTPNARSHTKEHELSVRLRGEGSLGCVGRCASVGRAGRISYRRTGILRRASCQAASLPANPAPTMVTCCIGMSASAGVVTSRRRAVSWRRIGASRPPPPGLTLPRPPARGLPYSRTLPANIDGTCRNACWSSPRQREPGSGGRPPV